MNEAAKQRHRRKGGQTMLGTGRWGARRALPLAAALMIGFGIAAAAEEARYPDPKYPDWRGQWTRQVVPGVKGQPSFDPNKSWGKGQEAPLTPEYQAVLEANLKA
jgi:hypothetical protein